MAIQQPKPILAPKAPVHPPPVGPSYTPLPGGKPGNIYNPPPTSGARTGAAPVGGVSPGGSKGGGSFGGINWGALGGTTKTEDPLDRRRKELEISKLEQEIYRALREGRQDVAAELQADLARRQRITGEDMSPMDRARLTGQNLSNTKLQRDLDSVTQDFTAQRLALDEKTSLMDDKLKRDIATGNWREAAVDRRQQREFSNQKVQMEHSGRILDILGMFAQHPMLFQTSVNQLPQLTGALGSPPLLELGPQLSGGFAPGGDTYMGPPGARPPSAGAPSGGPGMGPGGGLPSLTGQAVSGAGTRPYGPDPTGAYETGFPKNWVSGTYINNPRGPGSDPNSAPGYYIPGVNTPTPDPRGAQTMSTPQPPGVSSVGTLPGGINMSAGADWLAGVGNMGLLPFAPGTDPQSGLGRTLPPFLTGMNPQSGWTLGPQGQWIPPTGGLPPIGGQAGAYPNVDAMQRFLRGLAPIQGFMASSPQRRVAGGR